MVSFADVEASIDALKGELTQIAADLATLISTLKAGSVTQAQIDELAGKVAVLKTAADSLGAEVKAG